jgi:hypothetical protein
MDNGSDDLMKRARNSNGRYGGKVRYKMFMAV